MVEMNITVQHADYADRVIQWTKIRDALEGEDRIKGRGKQYLPKPSAQTETEYNAYRDRASFYAVAERTLRGMTGMVFRNEPTVELPTQLEPLRDVLTTDGYSLNVLAEEAFREVFSVGRYGMLLDFPVEKTSADEPPYVATYFAEDIINWEQKFVGGKKVLCRVVVRDEIDNTSTTDTEKYLELVLIDNVYTVRKWETKVSQTSKMNGSRERTPHLSTMTEEVVPTVRGKTLDYIPFFFINPYDLRPDVEKPPFTDLVNMNIAHYRNSADYEHALYLTAQPTPWVSGQFTEDSQPTTIGSGTLWILPEQGRAGMLEFQGAGITAQERAMEQKENRMASLGARMIHEGRLRNEASDTARMRGHAELSLLTNVVNMVETALQRLFDLAGEWVGAPGEISIKINRDWVESKLDGQDLTALVKARQSGAISRDTLHENLQKGELVPMDRTVEEERDLIEEEGGGLGLSLGVVTAPAEPKREARAREVIEDRKPGADDDDSE